MIRKLTAMFAFVFLAFGLIASPAAAAVTFDPATGTGFVGKGDVQQALGLNNQQIQNTDVNFTYNATVVTEVSWICTNERNEHTQERARTTTTETSGVVSSVTRVKNQITGYNLIGFSGTVMGEPTTEGNVLNSCPNSNSTWTLTVPAGEPEVISSTGGLYVNGVLIP